MVHPQSARLRARSEKMAEERDDGSDTSEESEIEEELGFFSLIDAINPYTTFKHALTSTSVWGDRPRFWSLDTLFSNSFPEPERGLVSGCDDDAERRTTDAPHGSHVARRVTESDAVRIEKETRKPDDRDCCSSRMFVEPTFLI